MNRATIIRYALASLAVVIAGALTGWYFFLRSQTSATTALNSGRGFSAQVPAGKPFGATGVQGAPFRESAGTSATTTGAQAPQLWHVTAVPVGGIGFATSTGGARLRYAERATGYVFEADPLTGGATRLTNSLTPKLYEAYFASLGRVLLRSEDGSGVITTFAGHINTATTSALSLAALERGIAAVAPDPKTDRLFYLLKSGTGVTGIVGRWGPPDGKQKQLFSSALADWRVSWLSDGRIILAQKASDSLAGYAYALKNGALDPLLPPLPGLVALPRSGSSALLYSTSSGGHLALFAQISATTSAARVSIATPADKCVWAPPNEGLVAYCAVPQGIPKDGFLDAWYRGETHSTDAIWRIDAGAGQAQLIFTPAPDIALDVTNPVMDDAGAYLAFMNNADLSPWILRLNK